MSVTIKHIKREYLYLVIIGFLILLLKVFDKRNPHIHFQEVIIVLIYFSIAIFVNYYLLPRFFYQGKIKVFFLLFLMIILLVVAFEELIFEKLFYPDGKGEIIYISGALIEIIPVFVMLVGFKLVWDAFEKQAKIEHLKRLVAESELQNINSQISPHFLFNNMNTLYAYAIEQSPRTPEIILQLSGILRYMLYDCKEKTVPLLKEIENLNNFINLNRIQMEQRGTVDFTYPEVLAEIRIAPLIFIVFVENAFKHSVSSQTRNIEILIHLELNNNKVSFICENTFSQDSIEDGLIKGIGLQNVKSRLNLVYKNKHTLKISKKQNIYRVSLNIDLGND